MCLAAAWLTGCTSLRKKWADYQDNQNPMYAVSLHLLAAADTDEGRLVYSVSDPVGGPGVRIRRIPLLSGYGFVSAEPVLKGDVVTAIAFALDGHGRMNWMQVTAEHPGSQVAVLVDGYYRFLWRLPRTSAANPERLTVEGPWDRREAELIAEHTPDNYEKLHSP